MARKLAWIALVAVAAAAFVMPGTAAAAESPYQVTVKSQACVFTGGAHGRGYIELKVKAREVGKSGTNYFVVMSNYQESSGLGYSTQWSWPKEKSTVFPDDATNYYHVTDRRHDFTRNDDLASRIQIIVKFKNNAGETLATRTVDGKGCAGG